MTWFTIVVRGLLRRPVRTGLTLLGIAIGIAAVVALVGIAWGFEKSWDKGFKARGTDVVVSNLGGGLVPSAFDAAVKERVARLPHVAEATGLLVQLLSVEDAPMVVVSAREWGGFTWKHLRLVEGRMPRDPAEPVVVLGRLAAEVLEKKVGDVVQVEIQDFTVVGIVDGEAVVENGAIIMALPQLQAVTANEGKINFINIRLAPRTSAEETRQLIDAIGSVFPEGRAAVASDVVGGTSGFRIAEAMSWATSLLAVLVGVLGVMNTMLMTVFERTHEIGVLLALGWKRRRIVGLVLSESALLGAAGGVLGVAAGALGVELLGAAPAVRGLLEPDLSPGLLAVSVLIALAVGVLSGLYPAWRSSRLAPGLAIRS